MVPNGWEIKNIDSICTVTSSKRIMQSDYVESGIPFYRSKEIILKSQGIEPSQTIYIENNKFAQLKKKFGAPKKGDILVTAVGTLGISYLVGNDKDFYFKDGNLLWLKDITDVDTLFLIQFMKSSYFNSEIQKITSGSSQKALTIIKLSKINLITPPLPEQKKIAKILTTWDKAISTTERLIDNSKQQKKALMQQLLTGKKRLLDDNGKRFEDEWKEVKLGNNVIIKSGVAPSTLQLKAEGDIPYIKVEDMNNCSKYQVDSRSYSSKTISTIASGAVIFPKRGAAIMNNKVRIATSKIYLDSNMMALLPSKNIESEFLYYLLIHEQLFKIADTSTIPQINNKHITPYEIKLPSILEQQKIAAVLTNADKEIDLLEQQLADLQQEKKALMQVLLTGKKRVVVDGGTA